MAVGSWGLRRQQCEVGSWFGRRLRAWEGLAAGSVQVAMPEAVVLVEARPALSCSSVVCLDLCSDAWYLRYYHELLQRGQLLARDAGFHTGYVNSIKNASVALSSLQSIFARCRSSPMNWAFALRCDRSCARAFRGVFRLVRRI